MLCDRTEGEQRLRSVETNVYGVEGAELYVGDPGTGGETEIGHGDGEGDIGDSGSGESCVDKLRFLLVNGRVGLDRGVTNVFSSDADA